MEQGNTSRSHLKRPLSQDDDDSNKPPAQKRARFPKGKKVKAGDETVVVGVPIGAVECPVDVSDPRVAAKERAKRRSQMTTELFSEGSRGNGTDITAAEVDYEDNTDFVDDGIQIEPFNLNQEREEGYFDADGNFVEYVNENEIKDAWLDSVDTVFTGKGSYIAKVEEDDDDLSSGDIGKIKRRIADLLEPGETVLHALKRMKGTTHGRKEKMSEETKQMFDQLTEDSMKLMDNGDYNVYHEKQEDFQREAEGYERLARAKEGASGNVNNDASSNATGNGIASSLFSAPGFGSSAPNVSNTQIPSSNAADAFDMFGEDDENPTSNPPSDHNGFVSASASASDIDPSSENLHPNSEGGDAQTDYIYDESSGYYYSSSLGYYYDPTSGLYCSASSGKWYSFNEQSGTYEEIQGEAHHPPT